MEGTAAVGGVAAMGGIVAAVEEVVMVEEEEDMADLEVAEVEGIKRG